MLAERYFKDDSSDQRRWYSEKAGLFRRVLIAWLSSPSCWVIDYVYPSVWGCSVGADSVGVDRRHRRDRGGWQRIARYSETWISYRTASERMKRERRLYTHGAGSYRGLPEREAI